MTNFDPKTGEAVVGNSGLTSFDPATGEPVQQPQSSSIMDMLSQALNNRTPEGDAYYSPEAIAARQAKFPSQVRAAVDPIANIAPAIAGAGATALLGPEVGYPAYLAVGGLSQGLTKAGLNKLQGKDAFNQDTAKEAALGAMGGGVQKAVSPVFSALARYLAPKLAARGLDATASELLQGILKGDSTLGPEVTGTIENNLESMEGEKAFQKAINEASKLENMSPKQLSRVHSEFFPEINELGREVKTAKDSISSLQAPIQSIGNAASNFGSQAIAPSLTDILSDRLKSVVRGNRQ